MTPNRCRTQVHHLLNALLCSNLAADCRNPVLSESRNGFSRVTWPPPLGNQDCQKFFEDFYAVEIHIGWLTTRQYSAALFDGSLLQMTFDFKKAELLGHRLAYIPCPFRIDDEGKEMLRSEPILDVIEVYRGRGEKYLRLRTPIRFGFDPRAAAIAHPASHITLNDQACRIPACAPLSVGLFIKFVFRHFYPEV